VVNDDLENKGDEARSCLIINFEEPGRGKPTAFDFSRGLEYVGPSSGWRVSDTVDGSW
jgi:hypothetical protein